MYPKYSQRSLHLTNTIRYIQEYILHFRYIETVQSYFQGFYLYMIMGKRFKHLHEISMKFMKNFLFFEDAITQTFDLDIVQIFNSRLFNILVEIFVFSQKEISILNVYFVKDINQQGHRYLDINY